MAPGKDHNVANPSIIDLTEEQEDGDPTTNPQGTLQLSDGLEDQYKKLGVDLLRWNTSKKTSHKGDIQLTPAYVEQIMRAVLPQHTRIEKEAREDMALFAVGYIQLLTSKASEIARGNGSRTICANHLLQGMEKSAFEYYTKALEPLVDEARAQKEEEEDRLPKTEGEELDGTAVQK